jgi:hypothetical protein
MYLTSQLAAEFWCPKLDLAAEWQWNLAPDSACKTRIDSPRRIGIVPPTFHDHARAMQTQLHHLSIDIIARKLLYITTVRPSTRVSAAIIKKEVPVPRGSDQTAVHHWPYSEGVSRLRRKCLWWSGG